MNKTLSLESAKLRRTRIAKERPGDDTKQPLAWNPATESIVILAQRRSYDAEWTFIRALTGEESDEHCYGTCWRSANTLIVEGCDTGEVRWFRLVPDPVRGQLMFTGAWAIHDSITSSGLLLRRLHPEGPVNLSAGPAWCYHAWRGYHA